MIVVEILALAVIGVIGGLLLRGVVPAWFKFTAGVLVAVYFTAVSAQQVIYQSSAMDWRSVVVAVLAIAYAAHVRLSDMRKDE